MTKLNDSIHRINPSILPKNSGVKNQEDNDKPQERPHHGLFDEYV